MFLLGIQRVLSIICLPDWSHVDNSEWQSLSTIRSNCNPISNQASVPFPKYMRTYPALLDRSIKGLPASSSLSPLAVLASYFKVHMSTFSKVGYLRPDKTRSHSPNFAPKEAGKQIMHSWYPIPIVPYLCISECQGLPLRGQVLP